jgi:RNA polymerase sigma-70 factor (ECF subfamily)
MSQSPPARSQWIDSALARYEGPLLRYASRFLGDVERARDVVQDTFLRLCSTDPAQLDGHLAQWLFTVCRNRALDVLRKEGRMQQLEPTSLADEPDPNPTPARALEDRESLRAVLGALSALPASQQEVLRLKFEAELSYEEIGAVVGLTVNHVGVLIHNGLKSIRTRLAGGESPAKAKEA